MRVLLLEEKQQELYKRIEPYIYKSRAVLVIPTTEIATYSNSFYYPSFYDAMQEHLITAINVKKRNGKWFMLVATLIDTLNKYDAAVFFIKPQADTRELFSRLHKSNEELIVERYADAPKPIEEDMDIEITIDDAARLTNIWNERDYISLS